MRSTPQHHYTRYRSPNPRTFSSSTSVDVIDSEVYSTNTTAQADQHGRFSAPTNSTTTALSRLATALGTQSTITFDAPEDARRTPPDAPPLPHSLVRLSRTHRFRRDMQGLAQALGQRPEEVSAQVIRALAQIAQAMGRDLVEADWCRLLDALLLVGAHPHTSK